MPSHVPASSVPLAAYASGLSRKPDFTAAAWAGHGIGVVAGELSRGAVADLARVVVDYQSPLFADSGAYGAFRAGRLASLDHARVLRRYDEIMQAIFDANAAEERLPAPLFVMPDVPCDQAATLRLIHSHRHYIATMLAFPGCGRPIIPFHAGARRLSRVCRDLSDLLGRDDYIIGIPSAAAALPEADAVDLFACGHVRHVHILGALSARRLGLRLGQMREAGCVPQSMSADANLLRSKVLRPGVTAKDRSARIAEELGRSARAAELDTLVSRLGGEAGLRAAYSASDADGKRRLIGLVADLSGQDAPTAQRRLSAPHLDLAA